MLGVVELVTQMIKLRELWRCRDIFVGGDLGLGFWEEVEKH